MVGVTPYFKTTTDAKNKLDASFAKAFKELNRQLDQHFNQYVAAVARKLRAWFNMFPPTSSPCAGGIAVATTTQRRGQGERMPPPDGEPENDVDGDGEEAMALSGCE